MQVDSAKPGLVLEDVTIAIEKGIEVVKEFFDKSDKSLGLFRGRVVNEDEDESDGSVIYRVLYEDGDSEDLSEMDCRAAINLLKKIKSGEIDEWDMGGDE